MQSVIVPQGTRINFDGEIVFATTEELEIKAGEEYGDILGECLTPGIVGNNIAAGQIKEIMDTYDFYWKVENITRTAGGADKESDQSYYERLRESMEGFSTAGPVGGYIYHVKSVCGCGSEMWKRKMAVALASGRRNVSLNSSPRLSRYFPFA